MGKIFRANMYFLIILLMEIFGPMILFPIYKVIGLNDTRIILFLNHVIIFLLPANIIFNINKIFF